MVKNVRNFSANIIVMSYIGWGSVKGKAQTNHNFIVVRKFSPRDAF